MAQAPRPQLTQAEWEAQWVFTPTPPSEIYFTLPRPEPVISFYMPDEKPESGELDTTVPERTRLQLTPIQRAVVQDVNLNRRRVVPDNVDASSAMLCDHCCADISGLPEISLVKPVRDLSFSGPLAEEYDGLIFCSPGCLFAMFYAKEQEHIAKELHRKADEYFRLLQRYPEESFVLVKRGARTGQTLGLDPDDDEVLRRCSTTKRQATRGGQ